MARNKADKTNALRILDQLQIPYQYHVWEQATGQHTGVELAMALGQDPARVFKTLVTVGKSGSFYVFLVPVAASLSLKKAAGAVGEKAVAMCKAKELLPLTGYIHGGCSPIGMKKQFVTTVHESAAGFETIFCSAGRIGCQLEITPENLRRAVPFQWGSIVSDYV